MNKWILGTFSNIWSKKSVIATVTDKLLIIIIIIIIIMLDNRLLV